MSNTDRQFTDNYKPSPSSYFPTTLNSIPLNPSSSDPTNTKKPVNRTLKTIMDLFLVLIVISIILFIMTVYVLATYTNPNRYYWNCLLAFFLCFYVLSYVPVLNIIFFILWVAYLVLAWSHKNALKSY